MKPLQSSSNLPDSLVGSSDGRFGGWRRFWFTPDDPLALHMVRFLCGLVFVAWLLPFAGHIGELYGLQGLFDQQARTELAKLNFGLRPSTWSLLYVSNSQAWAVVFFWSSVIVLALFTLGIWTRLTSVLTWVVVLSFTDNPALDYGADALLSILAFYLMIGHLLMGQRRAGQSLANRLLGPLLLWPLAPRRNALSASPSLGANIALRLLQVHIAIVFVTTGFHKLQSDEWWQGVALWYPLHPPMETSAEQLLEIAKDADGYFWRLSLATYAVLAWEIGFPLFAWRRGMRLVLLGGGVIGMLGIAFIYRLPTFGPAWFVGCVAFVSSEEWRRWGDWLTRLPVLKQLLLAVSREHEAGLRPSDAPASLIAVGQR